MSAPKFSELGISRKVLQVPLCFSIYDSLGSVKTYVFVLLEFSAIFKSIVGNDEKSLHVHWYVFTRFPSPFGGEHFTPLSFN